MPVPGPGQALPRGCSCGSSAGLRVGHSRTSGGAGSLRQLNARWQGHSLRFPGRASEWAAASGQLMCVCVWEGVCVGGVAC